MNMLDLNRFITDTDFYLVAVEKDGEIEVQHNYSPGTQRVLRTKEEAEKWKLGLERHWPNCKVHIISINIDPLSEMMWPEGLEEMLEFGKAYQRVKKEASKDKGMFERFHKKNFLTQETLDKLEQLRVQSDNTDNQGDVN